MTVLPKRAGVATGDVLLILAGMSLLAALAYPEGERALMRRHADQAQAHVEAVGAAAAAFRKERAAWPLPAEIGEVQADLAGYLPEGFSFRTDAFTLKWDRWEAVEALPAEYPELPSEDVAGAPPPAPDSLPAALPIVAIGAITVQAEDDRILAALLERFGPSRSFVREGSWTLVLPPDGGSGKRHP